MEDELDQRTIAGVDMRDLLRASKPQSRLPVFKSMCEEGLHPYQLIGGTWATQEPISDKEAII